ncbi:MAG TPA: C1 family peptidase [Bacteroidales bacterium]|nr:C1 family peptidase [Bacteroidales bacterium]
MKYLITLALFLMVISAASLSQDKEYKFIIKKEVPATPVKNQSQTSTCWSFSGLSFFESELMRLGKKQYDLSEMYVVNEAYRKKAEEYARRKGNCAFSPGGQYFDLLNISREYGLVPDNVYPGLNYGSRIHNHDELDAVLKGYMNGVIKTSPNRTPAWLPGFDGILDAYLGKLPSGFDYNGKHYTPKEFADDLGLDFNDYIVISSFSDHPYYKEAVLEVPDNWSPCTYYNLPVNEMIQTIDNAIMNGYSVAWASDMKGKGFNMKKGVAIVPEEDWDNISDNELEELFESPHKQKAVTQEIRQKEFGDYTITGDHGMHIIGIAEDQNGEVFYKVKNSWGDTGKYHGYIYVSREYVMLKTTNCMINKNSLPLNIAQKMGIEVNPYTNGAIAEGHSTNEEPARTTDQVVAAPLAH